MGQEVDMAFNPAKCEFLKVSNKSNNVLTRYYIQRKELKHTTSSKYLGVKIDEHLTWNDHVKNVISKANKVKLFLQHNIKASYNNSMIRPILK